jgi:hypothetical protein
MATNFYFNNFQNSQEQLLLESLIIESIKIYGEDMFYLPRTLNNKDEVYGTDDNSSYDEAILVELYIKNVDGFGGDGSFMSKFGLEIRDQVTLTIAKRVFEDEIGIARDFIRPREGDCIYFPLNRKIFQIKYVDNKPIYYPLGALQMFDLTCELFEYSGEQFNTGIPEIDDIQDKLSLNIYDYGVLTEDNFMLATEDGDYIVMETFNMNTIDPNADNDFIENEASQFLDFSERDPFSENGVY